MNTPHPLRRARAQALAALLRRVPNAEEAEDCVQTALVRGLELWTTRPMPDDVAAWLVRVGWNVHIDRYRKTEPKAPPPGAFEDFDDLERLLFLRCHAHGVPAASQPALVLRWLGGLSLPKIAEVLGLSVASVDKRLHRGRKAVEQLPEQVEPSVGPMLHTLGLVFGIAYDERSVSTVPEARMALALDLVFHLTQLYPEHDEVWATSAWLHLTAARTPARRDDEGIVLLAEEQERAKWSEGLLALGREALSRSMGDTISDWHLLAGIAAHHVAEEVNWSAVHRNHQSLHARHPDGRFLTGLAHATWQTQGPAGALALLQGSEVQTVYRWLLEARLLNALKQPVDAAIGRARQHARTVEQQGVVDRIGWAIGAA